MLFAFNVLGELESRIIEADSQEEAEEKADKVQQGVPVREARPEDMPQEDDIN
ncbi:MAG: hypothetical protein AB1589_22790 [Cyanobacteriota bacterium]